MWQFTNNGELKVKRFVLDCLQRAAISLLTTIMLFSYALTAQAALPPEVIKGVAWLQSQIQPDGSILNESLSQATPVQNRSEVLSTLNQLSATPAALINLIAADAEINTEYLSRRALILGMAGRDSSVLLSALAARQNIDGGFGGDNGHESNVQDTARVLLGYVYAGQGGNSTATAARNYLVSKLQADGGMPGDSNDQRLNESALGLSALLSVATDIATTAATQKLSVWLMQKQGVDGSWNSDQYLTAQILVAVYPTVTDAVVKNNARNFLLAAQSVDGSWAGDAFVTALALRALSIDSAPSSASGASLSGQVANLATGVSLAGATVTLVGSNIAPVQTGTGGLFSFTGLAAGNYTVQASKIGYSSVNQTYTVNAGQALTVGVVGLAQSQTTGIVKGRVMSGATSLPLAGVTVMVSGASTALTTTDAAGNYEVNTVTPGPFTITASLNGYVSVSATGTLLAGQTQVFSPALYTVTNPLVPTTGHFAGQVVAQGTGAALAGVAVQLNGVVAGITGADGRFDLVAAPANYHALISLAGYTSAAADFLLTAGASINSGTIALTRQTSTGTIRGQVIAGATSLPLAGVAISVSGSSTASVQTDATGIFEIPSIAPGAVNVTASLAGYTPVTGTGSMQAGQVVVFSPSLYVLNDPNAPANGHFAGRVVAQDSAAALAGVEIQLDGVVAGVTAADGSFDLVVVPGNYHVIIGSVGYDFATGDFLMTAGATVNTGTVSLIKLLTSTAIHGLVTDQTTGNPIAGASVQVVNGAVATTGVDGGYSLVNLAGLTFDLRVSAIGYTSQTMQLQAARPSDITRDFSLQSQSGSGLDLAALTVTPNSVAGRTDVVMTTTISNPSGVTPMSGVLMLDGLNVQGVVIGSGVAYDGTGIHLLGAVTLNPGESVPAVLRWNSGQYAPGAYTLVAHVSEAGSINATNPRGRILAERSATVDVVASPHFAGTVTADPPVLRANTNTPVHLAAMLQNDGNVALSAQTYHLQIVDVKTGAIVTTQDVAGNLFLPGELQNVAFSDWTPTNGGNYRAEISVVAAPEQGKLTATVYVGDAATGNFTVSKTVVPVGTQTVKGNIHISGQDVTLGSISDPLAPLIKAAVQKAVAYNDLAATNWTMNNKCLGCHVQTQALLGGEMTRHLTTFNASYRRTLFNALTNNQKADGMIDASHPYYGGTETTLALWSLNAWHRKDEIASSLVSAANFLINRQESTGRWTSDYPSGWWVAPTTNTAINLKSMVDVSQLLKQTPAVTAANYAAPTWVSGNGINGAYYLSSDAAENVYVSNYSAGTVSLVKPDGSVQLFMSGVTGVRTSLLAPDGNFYVISDTGLFKRNPDGTKSVITTNRGTGLALGPDGNLYVADYWSNKILMVTPQGTVSNYIVGGALNGPHGLAFSPSGDLLVANYANSKILRYKLDKSYESVVDWTNGLPYSIVQYGAGWLVGTSTGLYRYNNDWEGERLLYTNSYGLTVTPTGRIVTGAGGTAIFNVNKTLVNATTQLARQDGSITKATNWLLADTTYNANSNLELAHRLIGFGAAKAYYAGTAKEATIQAKMDQTAATLRTRQRADGGWGTLSTSASDSLVTAQVGVALDYMNPSAKDPVVQNALKYLLARQQPDGSWFSENGILSTHMAATTWVAIWLPIALDRIGGIDTDLSLTLPANVTLANPSLAPSSVQANASGASTYVWKIQGVTATGRDISFDATLNNLGVNETRPVATDAHLSFTNTFTQGKVDAPITIPSVTGSAYLTVGVATDLPQYGPNAPVTINALVANLASVVNAGAVKLEIYAADNVLVRDLGTMSYAAVAANGQQIQNMPWNTGAYASGGYYVLATLFDAQNSKVATATAHFVIVNGINGTLAGAGITVDKIAYQAYDNVQIADRISNLTQNQMLENLSAKTTLYNVAGTVHWVQSAPLGQLIAGDQRNLTYRVPLVNAPAGSYRAVLLVLDGTGNSVATAETTFTVQSSVDTGSGLKGMVTATPKLVPQGDPAILSNTVENLGNAPLTGLPVTLWVLDPASQQVMAEWPQTMALAQGQSIQNLYSFGTVNLPVGASYVAVLGANVGGKQLTLAQDNFTIVEPPVKLDVNQTISNPTRLLVLVSCPEYAYAATTSSTGGIGVVYADTMTVLERKRLCAENRASFLHQYLGRFGALADFVYDETGFGNGLRSGNYNAYWVSGHGIELHDDIVYELREAVYRGDALVIEDARDDLYDKLKEATGAGVISSLNPSALTINVGGALYQAVDPALDGATNAAPIIDPITGRAIPSLATVGAGHGLSLRNGILQAEFSGVTSETRGTTTIIQPGAIYPAIVSHDFGRGKSLAFAFDATGSLMMLATPNQWQALVQESVGYIRPALPDVYVGREYLAMQTRIQNLSNPVDLIAATTLPTDTRLLATQPVATLDAAGNPVWAFHLPATLEKLLDTTMRLPNISGTQRFDTTVDSTRNGVVKRYGNYPLTVEVVVALEHAAGWATEIAALPLVNKDRENRDSTVANLNAALASANVGNTTQAMTQLMAAIDVLRLIKGTDVLPYRVNLDRLLKELEFRKYCSSVLPRPAECGP